MEYLVAALAALTVAAVILVIVGGRKRTLKGKKAPPPDGQPRREPCPLCGSPLEPPERVRSEIFPGKGERLVHVWGCPHCFPANERDPRRCPVCHATLAPGAFVTGRMWDRRPTATGKQRAHLHLLGCDSCRSARTGA